MHRRHPASRASESAADRSGGKASLNGDVSGPRGGRGDADANGAKVKAKPAGKIAQFWERVLDEARKDPTYRKVVEDRDEYGSQ